METRNEKGEYIYVGPRAGTVIYNHKLRSKGRSKKISSGRKSKIRSYTFNCRTLQGNKTRGRKKRIWTDKGKKKFQEEMNKVRFVKTRVEKMAEEVVEEINKVVNKEKITIRKWRMGNFKWWNKSCTQRKREARKTIRKWKKGKTAREEYQKKRREYKEICEESKKGLQDEIEKEIMTLKNEN